MWQCKESLRNSKYLFGIFDKLRGLSIYINCITYFTYQWFYRIFAILGKRLWTIVHHTLVVVLHAEITDMSSGIFIEVMSMTGYYILPINFNILISLRRRLLMIESQSMQQLMDNNTMCYTFRCVKIKDLNQYRITYISDIIICSFHILYRWLTWPPCRLPTLDQQPE